MKFYQHSGVYEIAGDFAGSPEVATEMLQDAMRDAGIERSVIESLPSFIPDGGYTPFGYERELVLAPAHYIGWCYRLARQLEAGIVRAGFWRLVLELPDVRLSLTGIDIQARAEIGFKACMRASHRPEFRQLYAHDEFLLSNGLWQGSGVDPDEVFGDDRPGRLASSRDVLWHLAAVLLVDFPELNADFIAILGALPGASFANFLRAFELTLFDMGYRTPHSLPQLRSLVYPASPDKWHRYQQRSAAELSLP